MAAEDNQNLGTSGLENITRREAYMLMKKSGDRRQEAAIGVTLGAGAVAVIFYYFVKVPMNLILTCLPAGGFTVGALDVYLYHRNEMDKKDYEADPAAFCLDHYNRVLKD